MNTELLDKVTEELNNFSGDSYDEGRILCTDMGLLFNTFGSFGKMMNTIHSGLTESGIRSLILCMCAATFDMAYDYMKHGFYSFDERKAASEEYARNNLSFFGEEFETGTGWMPLPDTQAPSFVSGINPKNWELYKCRGYLGFISAWRKTHSTIKQSVYGGFVRGVLGDIYGIPAATRSSFAFI